VTALTPDTLYAEFRRAELLFAMNQPTEAARVLDPVVEQAPEHTAALELHARALFASAQLRRAELALRTLAARRPDDGWVQMALARTLERQGRGAAAAHRRTAQALGQAA
jgi:predicted Zn-dependent protease